MIKQIKKPIAFIFIFLLALGLSISLQSILAAWVAPTQVPPLNNINPPINESSTDQAKLGGLSLGGALSVSGNTSVLGNFGIGTASPFQTLDVNGSIRIGGTSADYAGTRLSYVDGGLGELTFYGGRYGQNWYWDTNSTTGQKHHMHLRSEGDGDNNFLELINGSDQQEYARFGATGPSYINARSVTGEPRNFGIGTSTPNSLFHVFKESGNNAEIDIQSVSGSNKHWAIYNERSDNSLKFWNNNLNVLSLSSDGNMNLAGALKMDNRLQQGSWNSRIPYNNITTLTINGAYSAWHNTIGIGSDGLPIILFNQGGASPRVKVLKCQNQSCTSSVINDIDQGIGSYVSPTVPVAITMGADGYPVLVYGSGANTNLKIAKCQNHDCSQKTITTLDNSNYSGTSVSVSISTNNGYPLISYYDGVAYDLKYIRCSNTSCTSFSAPLVLDSANIVGGGSSIVTESNGSPIISYYNGTGGNLKVIRCGNEWCNGGNTITAADTAAADVGWKSSITIGEDNLPVAAYIDKTNNNLKVLKCGNYLCNSGNSITTAFDMTGLFFDEAHCSIALGEDGNPIISVMNGLDIYVVKCGNGDCSIADAKTQISTTNANMSSITVGSDGLPIVSYSTWTSDGLYVIKCGSDRCVPYWTRR